jgi:hypothetical protein
MPSSQDGFRINYDAISGAMATYKRALDQVGVILIGLRRSARIEPWAADPISIAMAEHYNEQVFGRDGSGGDPYCTFWAIKQYERELIGTLETLERIQADYERAEGESAGSFDRL